MSQTVSSRVAGKLVAVTGAAMGLGQAAAIAFAEEGADLVVFDREEARLADTVAAVRALGRKAHSAVLDLTSEAEVVAAFAAARDDAGPIDILMNNVGGSARERAVEFWESKSEVWHHVIGLSLMPTLYCSRQVVTEMRSRGTGKIVNVASDAPLYGDARHCDYSAAKGGVIGFTRSLARELAPFGVTVNAICPGPIRTRAVEQLPRDMVERVAAGIPIQRFASPREVARVAVFLASADADYITGQSILVDGGRWMV